MYLPSRPLLSKLSLEFVVAERGGVQFQPRSSPPRTHLALRQADYNGDVICECSRQNSTPVILDAILRDTYILSMRSGASARVMCIGWSGRFLLPRIGEMKPTYHLGEGPASMEIAGCVAGSRTQFKSHLMMISTCPICNRCGNSAF